MQRLHSVLVPTAVYIFFRKLVMAKKAKSGINKSEVIRQCKANNPTWQPAQIAAILRDGGHQVSAQFVSTVLSNQRKKGGKIGKRGRKPGTQLGNGKSGFSHDNLIQFKKAIDAYGGVAAAKTAITTLETLGVN